MLNLAWNLAYKHLRKQRIFLVIVLISITFGVAERVGVGSMLASIQAALTQQSKSFLTADLAVKSTKPLSGHYETDLEDVLPSHTQKQQVVECLSIAVSSGNQKSALVEIRGVEPGFPFYGDLILKRGLTQFNSRGKLAILQKEPVAFLDQTLALKLGVKEGDTIRLGRQTFTVAGWVMSEPGQGAQGLAMGPRIYVGMAQLSESGLLDEGSRVSYQTLLKLPDLYSSQTIAKTLKSKWKVDTQDPRWSNPFGNKDGISVVSHQDKAKQLLRLFGSVGNYFTLITLVMLVLTSVAVAGVVRGYIRQLIPQLGVMQTIGLKPKQLWLFVGLIILMLSVVGTLLGGFIGMILYAIAHIWVGSSLPLVSGYILWKPAIVGMLEGFVMALFFSALPLAAIYQAKPLDLLTEKLRPLSKRIIGLILAVGVISLGSICSWETQSLTWGFALTIGVGCLGLLIYGLFYGVIWMLPRLMHGYSFAWEFGVHNLYRFKKYTLISMMSLTFGVLCLGLVSSYQASLLAELQMDQNQPWPDLFLIGIPDNQYVELSHFFKQWPSKLQLEPIIKARYTHLNGNTIQASSEERVQRLQNREQNLSFRTRLSESEKILKGEWNKGYFPTEASLEYWFAKQLNIHLGDSMTFDIQGVTVVARVTSFRTVKWNSFQPNFFILLTPEALNDAPKEWIGTVSGLLKEDRFKVASQLSDQFPNITVIDVAQTVERARDVLDKLVTAVQVLASAALVSGFLVIVGVILFTISIRQSDTALLKTLGFRYPMILKATASEFLWLTGLSAFLGIILASVFGWIMIEEWVGIPFHWPVKGFLQLFLGIIVVALVLSLWLARRLFRVKGSVA